MIIINQTKKTTLSNEAKEAKNLKDKTLGLTVYSRPATIIFSTRFGIHTFGMKFPIDVLILDKSNKVVSLKTDLKPNRIFFWNPKHSTVLELPVGTITQSKTELSDKIKLI